MPNDIVEPGIVELKEANTPSPLSPSSSILKTALLVISSISFPAMEVDIDHQLHANLGFVIVNLVRMFN
jgi:hypothetical protein